MRPGTGTGAAGLGAQLGWRGGGAALGFGHRVVRDGECRSARFDLGSRCESVGWMTASAPGRRTLALPVTARDLGVGRSRVRGVSTGWQGGESAGRPDSASGIGAIGAMELRWTRDGAGWARAVRARGLWCGRRGDSGCRVARVESARLPRPGTGVAATVRWNEGGGGTGRVRRMAVTAPGLGGGAGLRAGGRGGWIGPGRPGARRRGGGDSVRRPVTGHGRARPRSGWRVAAR